MRLNIRSLGAGGLVLLIPCAALARPQGPVRFCEALPEAAVCRSGAPACTYCHTSTDAEDPQWNAFGVDLEDALAGGDFDAGLAAALATIADFDSDQDGFANTEEIEAGSLPGDDQSLPVSLECPDDTAELAYKFCEFDARYVYRKLTLDFCGYSPRYQELENFAALGDMDAQVSVMHDTLDMCLQTEFWRGKDGVVWQLAHRKIRPVQALKAGIDPSPIENVRTADYYNDYNLFVYTQIDGHDARDVLLADYFVLRDGLDYQVVPDIGPASGDVCSEDSDCPANEMCVDGACDCPGNCREQVVTDRRQGLLTTRWVLLYNTMFTAIPRNTAAQAYRAFLGLDIAKQQGLFPAPVPPIDYDNKGITATACAVCHDTLEGLTMPFTRYQGFGPGRATYRPLRMFDGIFADEGPLITDTPENGYLFGQAVADLGDWALVATQSDQFASATVMDYWKLLLGRPPVGDETAEFETLWLDFRGVNGYSVDAMLHELIVTEAYSAP